MEEGFSMDHAHATRNIYAAQHARIAADETAMGRFIAMFSNDYFGLSQEFFAGARVIDVGCGNTAKLLIGLYNCGARDITGVELGTDFMAPTNIILNGRDISGIRLQSGDVRKLPFKDASFDFVACHGVLIHLEALADAKQGFAELARITKPGGYLYTVYGVIGGLLEDCIIPAMRVYYQTNPKFREAIDTLAPDHFEHLLEIIDQGLREHEGTRIPLHMLRSLFDVDFCVTIQNLLQAPTRLRIDAPTIETLYAEHRFDKPRRLRRYVKRANLRRYLAPLHYTIGDPLVSLLYGSGNLEFIARKT
jgi:ubiquinone/menaquinone biosynthesis C-methylase UbiE